MDVYSPERQQTNRSKDDPFSEIFGVDIGLPDYPTIAQLHRMLLQLDALQQSCIEKALKIPDKDPSESASDRRINSRLAALNQQLLDTESMDLIKVKIAATKAEIVELKDSLSRESSPIKPKVLYAPTYRLHNILVKLTEEMNRAEAHRLELKFVCEKQNTEVVKQRYRGQLLQERQEQLERLSENQTVEDYSQLSDSVRLAKHQEMLKVRETLLKNKTDKLEQHQKAYGVKMNSLLPLLDEAMKTDIYLHEIERTLLRQKEELITLEEVTQQKQDDMEEFQDMPIGVQQRIDVQTDRLRTEGKPHARSKTDLEELKDMYERKQSKRTIKKLIQLGERNIEMSGLRIQESRLRYNTVEHEDDLTPNPSRSVSMPKKELLRFIHHPPKVAKGTTQKAEVSLPALKINGKVERGHAKINSISANPRKRSRRELLERKADLMKLLKISNTPHTGYTPNHRLSSPTNGTDSDDTRVYRHHDVNSNSPILKPPFRNVLHL